MSPWIMYPHGTESIWLHDTIKPFLQLGAAHVFTSQLTRKPCAPCTTSALPSFIWSTVLSLCFLALRRSPFLRALYVISSPVFSSHVSLVPLLAVRVCVTSMAKLGVRRTFKFRYYSGGTFGVHIYFFPLPSPSPSPFAHRPEEKHFHKSAPRYMCSQFPGSGY